MTAAGEPCDTVTMSSLGAAIGWLFSSMICRPHRPIVPSAPQLAVSSTVISRPVTTVVSVPSSFDVWRFCGGVRVRRATFYPLLKTVQFAALTGSAVPGRDTAGSVRAGTPIITSRRS